MNRWALFFAALLFGASLLIQLGGGDIWWHIKTGQWILEHGSIPQTDPFSHSVKGPWTYTEAGSQVLYALTFSALGIAGIIGLHACLAVGWTLLIGRFGRTDFGLTLCLVSLWAATVHSACAPKPQIFTYLCFTILIGLVLTAESSPRHILWIPLVCFAWGWLHRGGVIALPIFGAVGLAWVMDKSMRKHLGLLALSTVLSLVALVANPGGYDYILSAFDLAHRHSFQAHLTDWQPASIGLIAQRHFALFFIGVFWIWGRLTKEKKIDALLCIVLGMALLTHQSIRFIPLLSVALIPDASQGLINLATRLKHIIRPSLMSTLSAVSGLTLCTIQVMSTVPAHAFALRADPLKVPIKAADFISSKPPPQNMWNSFDLGGYLLFKLSPNIPVFVDGRNDTVYPESLFLDAVRAPADATLFAQQVKRFDIGFVVHRYLGPSSTQFAFLESNPSWTLVYWDDVVCIWAKRDENAESIAYVEAHSLAPIRPRSTLAALMKGQHIGLKKAIIKQVQNSPDALISHILLGLYYRARGQTRLYIEQRDWVRRRAESLGLPIRLPPPSNP